MIIFPQLECLKPSIVEAVYSRYIQGMSLEDIAAYICVEQNYNMDIESVDNIIDQKNKINGTW